MSQPTHQQYQQTTTPNLSHPQPPIQTQQESEQESQVQMPPLPVSQSLPSQSNIPSTSPIHLSSANIDSTTSSSKLSPDSELRKQKHRQQIRRNRQIGRLRNIAENISLSIDRHNVESIKKIKKILGCTDEQLEEFRNFQQNEAKLLKMFGNFIDLGPQNDLLKTFLDHRKSHDKYTPELTDKFSVIDVVAQAVEKDDEKGFGKSGGPGKHKESNIKIKKLLGISDAHLEAYRNYQQHYKKLEKILGTFIQLDDMRGLKKIDQLEHHFGIIYNDKEFDDMGGGSSDVQGSTVKSEQEKEQQRQSQFRHSNVL